MKVIVASRATQGSRPDDFSWTTDGELVHLPAVECTAAGACGCVRSFVGATSHRATTTATVAERTFDEDDVLRIVLDGLVAGALVDPTIPGARQAGHWLAYALTADLLELAELTPVGTVIARHGDRFLLREPD